MIDFVITIILTSLFIWGVYCLFDSKHLLGYIGSLIEDRIGLTFCRPLFLCPPCMSSVYGTIAWLIIFGLSFKIIPFVICLTGLNFIIKTILFSDYVDTVEEGKDASI